MPKTQPPKNLVDELANETGRLRDMAIKSSDPLVVAKAVAISNEGVQQALLERLQGGDRLLEVFALRSLSADEMQVFFRLAPAGGAIQSADTGVLAVVDMHAGEVTGTVDPFTLAPERRAGRPFVSISALKASEHAATEGTMQPILEQERAFFGRLGLGGIFGGSGFTIDTVCDTGILSTTYSGVPYRADDTGKESVGDYCDSSGPWV